MSSRFDNIHIPGMSDYVKQSAQNHVAFLAPVFASHVPTTKSEKKQWITTLPTIVASKDTTVESWPAVAPASLTVVHVA